MTIAPRRIIRCLAPVCLLLAGCYRQDMARQPSFHWPDQASNFFPDGQTNRPIEPDTVARGQLDNEGPLATGRAGADRIGQPDFATEFPSPVSEATLKRGRERFNIYCSVCHGPLGYGDGRIVQRGYAKPPSYHDQRLRGMPVGQIFDVITRGFGAMPDYSGQIKIEDRWAIVAYVRLLQFSQNVPANDLTDKEKANIDAAKPQKPAEGNHGR